MFKLPFVLRNRFDEVCNDLDDQKEIVKYWQKQTSTAYSAQTQLGEIIKAKTEEIETLKQQIKEYENEKVYFNDNHA